MAFENIKDLDLIFGPESEGDTPEKRARSSSKRFVRSQIQLAEYSPKATGREISAWEAFQTFGLDKLQEVLDYGSAVLVSGADEPARTLNARRSDLIISVERLSRATGLSAEEIEDAENPMTLTSIHIIEKIAQALALDERKVSFVSGASGDGRLATRLKVLGIPQISPILVSHLCEAAWVSMKQHELYRWVYGRNPISRSALGFQTNPNYGSIRYPVWLHGYWLADEARGRLGYGSDEPIYLRRLIEERLEIPLIQFELRDTAVAGATIANDSIRGIAVNIEGDNRNVWVRRMTLAHELGHLLYDSDERLDRLRVDDYPDIQADAQEDAAGRRDYVEARANAFAVQFLAPQKEAVRIFDPDKRDYASGLRRVMEHFGLSYTSAKYHIWNGVGRQIPLEELVVRDYEPTAHWVGEESFATSYIPSEIIPSSRLGQFACLVARAATSNLLTEESAATYLGCTLENYRSHIDAICGICEIPDET